MSKHTETTYATVPLPAGFPDDVALPRFVIELGQRFDDAGYELALVGGPVRDMFLGSNVTDLDFTTDAKPDAIQKILAGWAHAQWDIGAAFGTIGARYNDWIVEITTYRDEKYDPESRKPEVVFGTELVEDLRRRDFTVNAMALRLPDFELVDPFGGVKDLVAGVLETPGTPQQSFSDDPLRMMRAARFAAQLGVTVSPDVAKAMKDMASRIVIISAERVREELVKLMVAAKPRRGLELLVASGLADAVLPELPALRDAQDDTHRHKDVYEHSMQVMENAIEREADYVASPNFVLRFAALMHDIGKPKTRRFESGGKVSFRHHDVVGAKMVAKRMRELRFDKETTKAVARLVELHMRFYGYGEGEWSDSAVRRYVTDAGDLLPHLHALTRSDVTTQNKRKARRLAAAYDDLEARIEKLAEEEELASIRPDLDGQQIMEILGLKPGPLVGRAYKFLLERRLDEGPGDYESTKQALLEWWAEQPEAS